MRQFSPLPAEVDRVARQADPGALKDSGDATAFLYVGPNGSGLHGLFVDDRPNRYHDELAGDLGLAVEGAYTDLVEGGHLLRGRFGPFRGLRIITVYRDPGGSLREDALRALAERLPPGDWVVTVTGHAPSPFRLAELVGDRPF